MKGKHQILMLLYGPTSCFMMASVVKSPLLDRNGLMFYRHSALVQQKVFRSWRYFVLQNQIISIRNVSLRCTRMTTVCIPPNISLWSSSALLMWIFWSSLPYCTFVYIKLHSFWNHIGSSPELHLIHCRH